MAFPGLVTEAPCGLAAPPAIGDEPAVTGCVPLGTLATPAERVGSVTPPAESLVGTAVEETGAFDGVAAMPVGTGAPGDAVPAMPESVSIALVAAPDGLSVVALLEPAAEPVGLELASALLAIPFVPSVEVTDGEEPASGLVVEPGGAGFVTVALVVELVALGEPGGGLVEASTAG